MSNSADSHSKDRVTEYVITLSEMEAPNMKRTEVSMECSALQGITNREATFA
jgi:hypothetical protein